MATSTFDRKIEIKDPESLKKLAEVMASNSPEEPLSKYPFSVAERERSRQLLRQYLSHSES